MLRVGLALMALAWLPVVLAFNAPGDPSIAYWLFAAAHGLNFGGYILAALADARAKRPFRWTRLAYTLAAWFAFVLMGPVVMSAAAARLLR